MADGGCEVELRHGADAQAVLQACFAHGIRLRTFRFDEPTLHDVFVKLVGPDAKEAMYR